MRLTPGGWGRVSGWPLQAANGARSAPRPTKPRSSVMDGPSAQRHSRGDLLGDLYVKDLFRCRDFDRFSISSYPSTSKS